MKKIILYILVCMMSLMLFGCKDEKTVTTEPETQPNVETNITSPEVTEPLDEQNPQDIWQDGFADETNDINSESIKKAKLFYNGDYVSFDKKLNNRKDIKYEFYTEDALRLVNSASKYAITIPTTEVAIDYSLSDYRVQLDFLGTRLFVSYENSSPYTNNISGWNIYLTEWLNRYISNPTYLSDNNLEYSREVISSQTILDGYEVNTYSIKINDNENISQPYYDITYIKKVGEYIEFYLFVMKSETNQSQLHDEIIKSFVEVEQFGTEANHVGQYELVANPNWNESTKQYFEKINNNETFDFGFFRYSLNDIDEEEIYNKVVAEEARISGLTGYNNEVLPTYTHLGWYNEDHYFPTNLANRLAGGNGYDDKPVLQFTLQYTRNNNNVSTVNKTSNYTPMFDILRGKYDEYFTRLAKDIKAYEKPVLFRLNNEMNTDWTSYCGLITLLDPDIFRLTWIRLYDIFEENGVDNCIWIFNPMAESCPHSSWGEDLCYMPGVEYVQALGLTRYEMLNDDNYYLSFEKGYNYLYLKNQNYWMNYPWVISEFGCASGGETTGELWRNKDIQAQWVKEMFECLKDKKNKPFCSKVTVAVWFNCNDYDGDGKINNALHLDSSMTEIFEIFKEGFENTDERNR